MNDIYEAILETRKVGGKAALATIVSQKGSTPAPLGSKYLVREDGSTVGTIGGGCVEAEVWEEAKKVIREGEAKMASFKLTEQRDEDGVMEIDGLICGGTIEVFIEPIISYPTVHIFGAGHVSLPLARMSKMIGFRVVVIDDREIYANRERFPDADEVVVSEFKKYFEKFDPDESSYIVIVTRGHRHDGTVLGWACRTEARYVGLMGSRAKKNIIYNELRSKGIPDEDLNRVSSPIGLEIGSKTPQEIAVSILAEMIRDMRMGKKGEK